MSKRYYKENMTESEYLKALDILLNQLDEAIRSNTSPRDLYARAIELAARCSAYLGSKQSRANELLQDRVDLANSKVNTVYLLDTESLETKKAGDIAIVGPDDKGDMHVITFPLSEGDKERWTATLLKGDRW